METEAVLKTDERKSLGGSTPPPSATDLSAVWTNLPQGESRHEFFCRRLSEMGLYDDDSDYSGMIGHAVEMLSAVLMAQRHSGYSIFIVMGVLNQLINEWKGSER